MLKNSKCTWSSRDCICSNFYLTTYLLNASLKRKTDNISIFIRRITTAERARAALQQSISITLPVCIGHRSLNAMSEMPGDPENGEFSLVYHKLRHLSAGHRQTFSGKTAYLSYTSTLPSYTNCSYSIFCSHTPYTNVVYFSVKPNIQKMICEIKIAANAISQAPRRLD